MADEVNPTPTALKTTLNQEELKIVAQALSKSTVIVTEAPQVIDLINKVSKMIDELNPETV